MLSALQSSVFIYFNTINIEPSNANNSLWSRRKWFEADVVWRDVSNEKKIVRTKISLAGFSKVIFEYERTIRVECLFPTKRNPMHTDGTRSRNTINQRTMHNKVDCGGTYTALRQLRLVTNFMQTVDIYDCTRHRYGFECVFQYEWIVWNECVRRNGSSFEWMMACE